MTPEEEAAELLPCEAPELCEAEYRCGVCLVRPAVAERLRQLHEAADHVADMLRESEAELENSRERIAELEAQSMQLSARIIQAEDEADKKGERIAALENSIEVAEIRTQVERIATLEAENERLRAACNTAVPTSWLDPLLTGPLRVLYDPPWGCPEIEKLLLAIKARLSAALAGRKL